MIKTVAMQLKENFDEIHPDLTAKEAIDESNRCLYCYDAPCTIACPTSIDIPSFIKKITSGNLRGSAKTIMQSNPVGASCARVCPTEELCEGACVLNDASKPIKIGDLQRYATNWAIKNEQVLFKAGKKNGKKIAIIGSGPAGLSAARELALLGYYVTIFEAEEHAGGLNHYGIVSFRLPQEIAFWEVKQVENLEVEIRTNTRVGTDISISSIKENFDRVILAVGMATVPELGMEAEAEILDAIEFVKRTKSTPLPKDMIGKKVVVIGAGNTAIDAATCSVRLGASNVKMLYRRTRQEMTAYDFEYDLAKQDGVEFRWLTQPTKLILDSSGKVKGLECMKMRLAEAGADGRRRPVPVPDSLFRMDADFIIKAIGQTRHVTLMDDFSLKHINGVPQVDPATYQTSEPMIYACGDSIFQEGNGEAMVVTAAEQGKKVAYSLHQDLFGAKETAS
ncbi:NAD(P)-dependent oxidoreductase [Gracilibacillus salinarum]|uniref:NAD(P)-dependent oxidoreductase n=1 Tax=Gracilibacillus salinarum TaxID=2932255 RepID=A0ABY4GJS5_9BACI|nr:NAD(P)-dependent oxidoreductase [Gracilibacillus salinarum]UOQ84456.1 NAD(P)-dependent oxidoreductase [Gracilibacillus salinarum]